MNLAILVGTVVSEVRRIDMPSGGSVSKFRLKTVETMRVDGELRERSQTHLIDVWSPYLQEHITPYIKEGQMVEVQGSIESRNTEKDRNAPARWTTTIVVRQTGTINVYGAPGSQSSIRADASEGGAAPAAPRVDHHPRQPAPALADDGLGDDVPF